MISDPTSNNRKCGVQGSTNRVFDLRGNIATESNCKAECAKNNTCVAFSAIWNEWCIGCNIELSAEHDNALGFKKEGEKYHYSKFLNRNYIRRNG